MLIDTSHLSQGKWFVFISRFAKWRNYTKKITEEALDFLNICRESRKIILKDEQKRVMNDVLAILSVGFGRSMIYTIFTLANQDLHPGYLPLPCKGLIEEQIVDTSH